MPQKDMPKEVSIMGGCPVLGVSSHLLNLAELEAEGKAKAPRLRAQQRGRVAEGKKGRFRAALRHLWGKIMSSQAHKYGFEVCRPSSGSYFASTMDRRTQARRSKRQRKSRRAVPEMPPQEEKG
ncbi:hypothetical protein LCGC14_1461520 [marine sediment metagenome]|uniref:Uncharacterized protein n=1 Tax=marine sediment metagenome TaxID=412755 RepID=A0A0F9JFJ7_9ZZZZ